MVQIVLHFQNDDVPPCNDYGHASSTITMHDGGHIPRQGDDIAVYDPPSRRYRYGRVEQVSWSVDVVPTQRDYLVGGEDDAGVPVTFCRRVEIRCRAFN